MSSSSDKTAKHKDVLPTSNTYLKTGDIKRIKWRKIFIWNSKYLLNFKIRFICPNLLHWYRLGPQLQLINILPRTVFWYWLSTPHRITTQAITHVGPRSTTTFVWRQAQPNKCDNGVFDRAARSFQRQPNAFIELLNWNAGNHNWHNTAIDWCTRQISTL